MAEACNVFLRKGTGHRVFKKPCPNGLKLLRKDFNGLEINALYAMPAYANVRLQRLNTLFGGDEMVGNVEGTVPGSNQ